MATQHVSLPPIPQLAASVGGNDLRQLLHGPVRQRQLVGTYTGNLADGKHAAGGAG
jgi:hypothetical protein